MNGSVSEFVNSETFQQHALNWNIKTRKTFGMLLKRKLFDVT